MSTEENNNNNNNNNNNTDNNSTTTTTPYNTRSPWAGRRRHHGVIDLRDTGDTNRMTVVRDQTRRRELLTRDPAHVAPQPPVDTKHPVSQLQDRHITDMHDVEKRHRPPKDPDLANRPRRGWRK